MCPWTVYKAHNTRTLNGRPLNSLINLNSLSLHHKDRSTRPFNSTGYNYSAAIRYLVRVSLKVLTIVDPTISILLYLWGKCTIDRCSTTLLYVQYWVLVYSDSTRDTVGDTVVIGGDFNALSNSQCSIVSVMNVHIPSWTLCALDLEVSAVLGYQAATQIWQTCFCWWKRLTLERLEELFTGLFGRAYFGRSAHCFLFLK